MRIDIKTTNLTLTPSLREYIENKIGSLAKFIKRFDMGGGLYINIEVGRTSRHHYKGNVYRAEANIRLPSKLLRAVDENFDIRVAIDKVRHKLLTEITKYKSRSNQ